MAVIGTHASDTPIGGYSDIPRHVVSVLEGMKAEGKGSKTPLKDSFGKWPNLKLVLIALVVGLVDHFAHRREDAEVA